MAGHVDFGIEIRNYREKKKLTRWQVAELCDVSDKCIENIELGQSDPRLSTVLKMAWAVEMDIGELNRFIPKENEANKN